MDLLAARTTDERQRAQQIDAIKAMLDTRGYYINPTDVFNKKAGLELMKNRKEFDKKVKHLVKKFAKSKW